MGLATRRNRRRPAVFGVLEQADHPKPAHTAWDRSTPSRTTLYRRRRVLDHLRISAPMNRLASRRSAGARHPCRIGFVCSRPRAARLSRIGARAVPALRNASAIASVSSRVRTPCGSSATGPKPGLFAWRSISKCGFCAMPFRLPNRYVNHPSPACSQSLPVSWS